ncbi:MAG: cyclic lactone autoinducer peptide [Anaerocolumna sp.]
MKKELKKLSLEKVSKVIMKAAVKEANSACFFIGYQPELPKAVLKLRNF